MPPVYFIEPPPSPVWLPYSDSRPICELRAGAYVDNPVSARVLRKCGFRYTHTDRQWCAARGEAVFCRRYRLSVSATDQEMQS